MKRHQTVSPQFGQRSFQKNYLRSFAFIRGLFSEHRFCSLRGRHPHGRFLLAALCLLALLPGTALATEASSRTPSTHPYGVWSLLPPLLAIGLAIATRRIHLSLLVGVFCGAWIAAQGWNPSFPLVDTCESYLWPQLIGGEHLRVFAFTLAMGAMVGVISRSGGMLGLVDAITPWAKDRRRGQLTGWGLGMVVFFDDYANTLLLGNTLRPVSDRLKISREKLAYIVDSTAAPVAGLALISTWIATEVGYIESGYKQIGEEKLAKGSFNAFDVFVETIPYRFYPLLALVFVVLVAALARDFGPMLTAERKALRGKKTNGDRPDPSANETESPNVPARWYNAMVPVGVVLVAVLMLILVTGWQNVAKQESPVYSFWNLFTQGDSYLALMYGALAGLLTIVILVRWQRLLTVDQVHSAARAGAWVVVPALAILWLAWSLQAVCKELQTAEYLGHLLQGAVAPALLPTLVFIIAAAVAFATGTSWGTMGILTPIVVPVSFNLLQHSTGVAPSSNDPVMLASVGSVLAGAIFGDHCSPISDTTVLSSAASGCDHLAHVRTQMPYAIVVGGVSILCGTLPAGFGIPMWGCLLCLAIGCAALAAFLWLFGQRAEDSSPSP